VVEFAGVEAQDLTVEEVAKLFRVSRDTVRRWLREGRLKGIALGGRAGYRIGREEVRRFRQRLEAGDGR
jgi:excisionase family DNA binding protein